MIDMRKIILVIVTVVAVILLVSGASNMFTHVDAGEHVVIQSVGLFGPSTLTWYHDPGFKWQGWGKVTPYRKSFQYWFSSSSEQGETRDQSIKVRFNDGGHANISGSVRVDMPTDDKALTELHVRYGSQPAIEQQLVRTVIEKAVYMSGPMMSSKESYAERRNELISLIEDQAAKGVYRTETKSIEVTDPLTGEKRKAAYVEIMKKDGIVQRVEESPLTTFNVRLFNLSINDMKYDPTVENQIAEQQKAIMSVQTALANARRAEQDAITIAKQGEANAAKTKWEQEMINAKVVSESEGRMKAAEFDKRAAEFTKAKDILLGEGEAARKKLVMEANGALDTKLDAYVQVHKFYAEAMRDMKQPLVPSVIMGGSGSTPTSAQSFMDLLQAKTAKDLAIEFNMQKGGQK